MAVIKVIELIAESKRSWEDAAQVAVAEAAKTITGIRSIYVKNLQAEVNHGKISQFRINAKISFLVGEKQRARR